MEAVLTPGHRVNQRLRSQYKLFKMVASALLKWFVLNHDLGMNLKCVVITPCAAVPHTCVTAPCMKTKSGWIWTMIHIWRCSVMLTDHGVNATHKNYKQVLFIQCTKQECASAWTSVNVQAVNNLDCNQRIIWKTSLVLTLWHIEIFRNVTLSATSQWFSRVLSS